eukprot:Gregarina_sp_Poly_1__2867@NODE_17_length_22522_cov_92_073614_g15_i0_p1_GENE_NODE_17_length_22522_cov_92_073614_g15_i0NODE_17_length_22522_cov_92_073614_g15_i0_p1_ORF_typecomplete_len3891_score497_64FAT/PF02259_23/5_8e03FAT/PF02259_23/1_5e03FAT/PF02259_23/7_8e10FAT/PF02259_23/0_02FRB_dom/PF08771_11/8_6e02FRB_dom/PF08771_11/3_7e11PI3_PI4_kinase/PF00454_27/4_9e06DUF4693/PF15764_5/0_017TetR_C_1/PF02909_17/0_53NippedB_C/PF12830_7/10NippedB_C/PF12830_7/1_2e02_NODE_17_length_22522_cov_92_073614_g15_i01
MMKVSVTPLGRVSSTPAQIRAAEKQNSGVSSGRQMLRPLPSVHVEGSSVNEIFLNSPGDSGLFFQPYQLTQAAADAEDRQLSSVRLSISSPVDFYSRRVYTGADTLVASSPTLGTESGFTVPFTQRTPVYSTQPYELSVPILDLTQLGNHSKSARKEAVKATVSWLEHCAMLVVADTVSIQTCLEAVVDRGCVENVSNATQTISPCTPFWASEQELIPGELGREWSPAARRFVQLFQGLYSALLVFGEQTGRMATEIPFRELEGVDTVLPNDIPPFLCRVFGLLQVNQTLLNLNVLDLLQTALHQCGDGSGAEAASSGRDSSHSDEDDIPSGIDTDTLKQSFPPSRTPSQSRSSPIRPFVQQSEFHSRVPRSFLGGKSAAGLPTNCEIQIIKYHYTVLFQFTIEAIIGKERLMASEECPVIGVEQRTEFLDGYGRRYTEVGRSWEIVIKKIKDALLLATTPLEANIVSPADTRAQAIMNHRLWIDTQSCLCRLMRHPREQLHIVGLPASERDFRMLLSTSIQHCLNYIMLTVFAERSQRVVEHLVVEMAILDVWPQHAFFPWSLVLRKTAVQSVISMLRSATRIHNSYTMKPIIKQWRNAFWSKIIPLLNSPLAARGDVSYVPGVIHYGQLAGFHGASHMLLGLLSLKIVLPAHEAEFETEREIVPFSFIQEEAASNFQIHIVRQITRKALLLFTPMPETGPGRRNVVKAIAPPYPGLSIACLAQCLGILRMIFSPQPGTLSLVNIAPDPRLKDDLVAILNTLTLLIRIASLNDKNDTAAVSKLLRHLVPDILVCMRLIVLQAPEFLPWRAMILRALRDSLKLTHTTLWHVLDRIHCNRCIRNNISPSHKIECCCDEDFGRERQGLKWQREVRHAALKCAQTVSHQGIVEPEEKELLSDIVGGIVEIVDWANASILEAVAWICKTNPWLINHVHKCAVKRFWSTLNLQNPRSRPLVSTLYLSNSSAHTNSSEGRSLTLSVDNDSSSSGVPRHDTSGPSDLEPTEESLPVGGDYLLFISISCLALLARLRSTQDLDERQYLVFCTLENLMRTHRHPWVRCQSALTLLATQVLPKSDDGRRDWGVLSNVCLNVLQSIMTDSSPFVKATFAKRFENSPYCDYCDARTVDLLVYSVSHARDPTSQIVGVKLLTSLMARYPVPSLALNVAGRPRGAVEQQLLDAMERIIVTANEYLSQKFISNDTGESSSRLPVKIDVSMSRALRFFVYLVSRINTISLECSYQVLGKFSVLIALQDTSLRDQVAPMGWQDDFLKAHAKLVRNSKLRFSEWVKKLNAWIPCTERGTTKLGCSMLQFAQVFNLNQHYHYGVELSNDVRMTAIEIRNSIPFTYIAARSAMNSVGVISLMETVTTARQFSKASSTQGPRQENSLALQLTLKALRILMSKGSWVTEGPSTEESRKNILRREFFEGYLSDQIASFCLLLCKSVRVESAGLSGNEAADHAALGLLLQLMKTMRLFLQVIPDWRCLNPAETFSLIQRGLLTSLKKALAHHPSHGTIHEEHVVKSTREREEPFVAIQSVRSQTSAGGGADPTEEFSSTCLLLSQEGRKDSDCSSGNESNVSRNSEPNLASGKLGRLLRQVWCEMLLTIGTFGFLASDNRNSKPVPLRSPLASLSQSWNLISRITASQTPPAGSKSKVSGTDQSTTLMNFQVPFAATSPQDFEKLSNNLLQSEREVWKVASLAYGVSKERPGVPGVLGSASSSFSSMDFGEGLAQVLPVHKDVFMYRVIYHLTRCIWYSDQTGSLNRTWGWRIQELVGDILDEALLELQRLSADVKDAENEDLQALSPLKKWSFWSDVTLLLAPRLLEYGSSQLSTQESLRLAVRLCQCVAALDQSSGREHYYETARLVHTSTQARDGDVFSASILQLFVLLREVLNKAVTALQIQVRKSRMYSASPSILREMVGALRPHLMIFQSFLPFYPFFGPGVVAKVATVLNTCLRSCIEMYGAISKNGDLVSTEPYDVGSRTGGKWNAREGFDVESEPLRDDSRRSAHRQSNEPKGSPKHGASMRQVLLGWISDLLLTVARLGSAVSPWSHFFVEPVMVCLCGPEYPVPLKLHVVDSMRVLLTAGSLSPDCVQQALGLLSSYVHRSLVQLVQAGEGTRSVDSRIGTAFDPNTFSRLRASRNDDEVQAETVLLFAFSELISIAKAVFPGTCSRLVQSDTINLLQELIGSPFYSSLLAKMFKDVYCENKHTLMTHAVSVSMIRSASRPSFDNRSAAGSVPGSESAEGKPQVSVTRRQLPRLSWTLSAPSGEPSKKSGAKIKAVATGEAVMQLITDDSPNDEQWKIVRRNSETDPKNGEFQQYPVLSNGDKKGLDSLEEMAAFEQIFDMPHADFKYQDWAVWVTNWMLAHLRYSPAPSIRSCIVLEQWFQNHDDDSRKIETSKWRKNKDPRSLSISKARMILKVPGAGNSMPIPTLLVDLFPVAYLSVWQRLPRKWREKAIEVITAVLTLPDTPRPVVTLCVNLIEYLLHFDYCADFDYVHLATLCHRFSLLHQALFFWEGEWGVIGDTAFLPKREAVLSALLSLNSACNQIDGVLGVFQLVTSLLAETAPATSTGYIRVRQILKVRSESFEATLKEETNSPEITVSINEQRQWYEQMHCWGKAVELYHLSQSRHQTSGLENQLEEACGLLRCLCEMNDWKSMQRILNSDLDSLVAQCINLHGGGLPAFDEKAILRSNAYLLNERPIPKIASAFPLTQESLINRNRFPDGTDIMEVADKEDECNPRHVAGYIDDSRFRSNARELIRLSCLSALHLQDWTCFQQMATHFIAINQTLQQMPAQQSALGIKSRRRSTRSSNEHRFPESDSTDNLSTIVSDNEQSESDLNLILYGPFGVLVSEHKFFATMLSILSGNASKARKLLNGLIEAFARKFAFVAVALKENENINTLALLRAQQFTELSEIIECLDSQKVVPASIGGDSTFLTPQILKLWNNRDDYADWKSPDIALAILTTRSIALPSVLRPMQWLTLADLCENDNKVAFAKLIEEGLINERRPAALAWLKYIATIFQSGTYATPDAYASLTRVEAVRLFKTIGPKSGAKSNICTLEQVQALRAGFEFLKVINERELELGRGFLPSVGEMIWRMMGPQLLLSRITAGRTAEILEFESVMDLDNSILLDTSTMRHMVFSEEIGTKEACHALGIRQVVSFMRKMCFQKSLFDEVSGFEQYRFRSLARPEMADGYTVYEAVCNPGPHCLFYMFALLCYTLTTLDPYDVDAWQALAQLNFDVVKESPKHWIRQAIEESRLVASEATPAGNACSSRAQSRAPLLPPTDCVWCRYYIVEGVIPGTPPTTVMESSRIPSNQPCLKMSPKFVLHCASEAVKGYLQCIRLCADASNLGVFANLLRVLNLWFEAWEHEPLNQLIKDNLADIPSTVWIEVVPQLLSRMSRKKKQLMPTLQDIFTRLVDEAPQALIFPLGVSAESPLDEYSEPARKTLVEFGLAHPQLVEESLQFIRGMKNTAVKPHENWYLMLDEAAKRFFDEHNSSDQRGAIKLLETAFQQLEEGTKTPSLSSFLADFREHITRARWALAEWSRTQDASILHIVWGIIHDVYAAIWRSARSKQNFFSLWGVAPEVASKVNWNLAVPGEYTPSQPQCPYIFAFFSLVKILPSKQKPRYMEVLGSDGIVYGFLLKGHEDLRQDQRAIQVLHFLDQLMQSASAAALPARYVSPFADVTASLVTLPGAAIATGASVPRFQQEDSPSILYPIVVPLSDSVGLIQWLSAADTVHSLVKIFRSSLLPPRSVAKELQLIREACAEYEALGAMQQTPHIYHPPHTCRTIIDSEMVKTAVRNIQGNAKQNNKGRFACDVIVASTAFSGGGAEWSEHLVPTAARIFTFFGCHVCIRIHVRIRRQAPIKHFDRSRNRGSYSY